MGISVVESRQEKFKAIGRKLEGKAAMLSEKMEAAFNKQITAELYASNLYLAMGAYFDAQAYRGFGHWLRMQSEEERQHALRIVDIVVDRGGTVDIQAIEACGSFESPLAIFEQVVAQEQRVTQTFHVLSELAEQERDHTTLVELEWFLLEQVEEERVSRDILKKVERLQDSASGMLELDRELGGRTVAEEQEEAEPQQ